jgi:predicted dehydrogenase
VLIKRILIVGFGSIGKRHLRLARSIFPNANIRILLHREKDYIPDESNGVFYDIDSARNFSPQITVIANPASFHIHTAKFLAKAGTHLLIEKPMSNSLVGVRQLIQTCKEKDLVLMIGYNLRFSKSLEQFRKLLNKKIIGKIYSVRCEVGQYLPNWRPDKDYRKTVSALKSLGGGVLLELSHEIDYLRWIFGEISWVNASVSHQSNLDIDVEDLAHITFGFELPNDKSRLICNLSLDFFRHDSTRTCIAIGEKASLIWNGLTGEVKIYKKNSTKWKTLFTHAPDRDETYLLQWKNFITSIQKKTLPNITGEDGLAALNIINAIRKSSKNNKRVNFLNYKE